MKHGRPVSPLLAVECHIHLRLRVGEDDDLIAFLNTLPARRRASTIKSAFITTLNAANLSTINTTIWPTFDGTYKSTK